jgi:hypothetical protein
VNVVDVDVKAAADAVCDRRHEGSVCFTLLGRSGIFVGLAIFVALASLCLICGWSGEDDSGTYSESGSRFS